MAAGEFSLGGKLVDYKLSKRKLEWTPILSFHESLGDSRNDMVLALHHAARIGARRDVTEVDVVR